jgi:hypothetical protein
MGRIRVLSAQWYSIMLSLPVYRLVRTRQRYPLDVVVLLTSSHFAGLYLRRLRMPRRRGGRRPRLSFGLCMNIIIIIHLSSRLPSGLCGIKHDQYGTWSQSSSATLLLQQYRNSLARTACSSLLLTLSQPSLTTRKSQRASLPWSYQSYRSP